MKQALTIAGSDSGGGAGIQADLKTFAALGVFGASVVTAVTAQNTLGVTGIHHVPRGIVAAQLDAVLDDLPVAAVKVGMLGSVAVAEVVASRAHRMPGLVVDRVLVSTTGSRLGPAAAVEPLRPYATVLTPNRDEAGPLLGRRVTTASEMAVAAADLAGPASVVVTGSEGALDVLHHDGAVSFLRGAPVDTRNTHGSGCTFAAAIAVGLARGDGVPEAVRCAKDYVAHALVGARDWRLGGGPGPLHHFWRYA